MTSPSLTELTERIVQATLDSYGRLPKHGKPAIRNNGVPEWTILASISLTTLDNKVIPISLGTGVKVLPATRLPPLGDTVHDCHAEVLARRGFVRWLLAEAERDMSADSEDTRQPRLVQWDAQRGRFALAPGVQVWLYVSALPCGDASTLHTSVHQATEVADAFAAAPEFTVSPNGAVRGRKGYETYGAIRTKPGRADSPPSISFSCSDKIATWNVLGLQGGLLSALFGPVYLDHIVVGGVETPALEENSSEWEDKVAAEAQRALYGRLEHVKHLVQQPYRLASPHIHLTPTLFPFSKPAIAAAQTDKDQHKECATSTVSLSHVPAFGKPEVIMNGCAQTSGWKAPGHTLLKDKQRSRLSKIEIMRAFLRLKAATGTGDE